MKDAYYFSHDSNARNDQRLIKVRMKYGMEGYGIYFGIIEIMREQEDYSIGESDIESVAYDLRSEKEMVQDILYNHRLFEIGRDIDKEEAYFFSKSLKRRMEKLDLIKQKRAEAGRKGGKVKPSVNQMLNNSLTSKVENSKVKKNKVKDISEREAEFKIKVFSDEHSELYDFDMLDSFMSYWTEPNKSNNTKMRYEEQKYFDIKRRLATWKRNNYGNNNKNGVKVKHNFKMPDGKNYLAWCSKCLKSDFYEFYNFNPLIIESKCCNAIILDENEKKKRMKEKTENVK